MQQKRRKYSAPASRGWVVAASFLLMAFLSAGRIQAQVPDMVNYQGVLLDQDGVPYPQGNYQLACNLYDNDNSLIWGATYYTQVLTNGAYNILLGAGGGAPSTGAQTTNLTAAFNGPSRYLGVTVLTDENGNPLPSPQEIAPRQQILSAPYAITAGQAAQATTLYGSNVTLNGAVILNGAIMNLFQNSYWAGWTRFQQNQWNQAQQDLFIILQYSGPEYDAQFQLKASATQTTPDQSWPIKMGSSADGGFMTFPVAAGQWWQLWNYDLNDQQIQFSVVYLGST